MRTTLALIVMLSTVTAAYGQTGSTTAGASGDPPSTTSSATPREQGGGWHATLSLMNMFDGNINHDPAPIRSYGVAPGGEVRYESSDDPAFVWGYETALNSYTGTDEWDRISHGTYAVITSRIGKVFRFETTAEAIWKGSSEDREVANEFGVSERLNIRLRPATRVMFLGGYRYKQYPDDPGTTGPSPYLGARFDQRLPGNRRVTVGYKFQSRLSRTERDRYSRNAFTADFSTPLGSKDERMAVGFEYRPQWYQRVIKVPGGRAVRRDRRIVLDAAYERRLNDRVTATWTGGLESRNSNDEDKKFTAPTFAMTLNYRWR
jgi:hypothetical protein